MALKVDEQFNLIESFLDLTSDLAIREAAYPLEEWIQNGGGQGSGFLDGLLNSYSKIATQDNPPEIIPQDGLLSLYKPEPVGQDHAKRAENIAAHWKRVQAHAYYQELSRDDNINFKNAWGKFQKKKDKKTNDLVSIVKKLNPIDSEFADFRFCNLVTSHVGFQILLTEFNYEPKTPNAKLFVKAKGHIEKLQGDIRNGIKLNSPKLHHQFETLLNQLILEIDQAPKKDYETPTAKYRKCLESFALNFRCAFGFVSPSILNDLAAMLEWSPDHTTIDRIVRSTKSKQAQLLAKALREYPAQNSQN